MFSLLRNFDRRLHVFGNDCLSPLNNLLVCQLFNTLKLGIPQLNHSYYLESRLLFDLWTLVRNDVDLYLVYLNDLATAAIVLVLRLVFGRVNQTLEAREILTAHELYFLVATRHEEYDNKENDEAVD